MIDHLPSNQDYWRILVLLKGPNSQNVNGCVNDVLTAVLMNSQLYSAIGHSFVWQHNEMVITGDNLPTVGYKFDRAYSMPSMKVVPFFQRTLKPWPNACV